MTSEQDVTAGPGRAARRRRKLDAHREEILAWLRADGGLRAKEVAARLVSRGSGVSERTVRRTVAELRRELREASSGGRGGRPPAGAPPPGGGAAVEPPPDPGPPRAETGPRSSELVRTPGEIHTFTFVPRRSWHPTLFPDLYELGPVSEFDYEAHGYRVSQFRACGARGVRRRQEMNDMVLPALRKAHAERPVDWMFVYARGEEIQADVLRAVVTASRPGRGGRPAGITKY